MEFFSYGEAGNTFSTATRRDAKILSIDAWNKRAGLKEEAVFHESVTPDPEETFFLVPHCPCCGGAAHISTPSFGWIGEVEKFSIACSDYSKSKNGIEDVKKVKTGG